MADANDATFRLCDAILLVNSPVASPMSLKVPCSPPPAPRVAQVLEGWKLRYGAGSVWSLMHAWCAAAPELDADGQPVYGDSGRVEQQHIESWGSRALRSEKHDELARDEARAHDAALVAYQSHWERRLKQLARRYPERFAAPGLSPEELRDTLTLHLIEAVRHPERDSEFTLPGKEWGLVVVTAQLRELRRRFRLRAEVTDLRTVTLLQEGCSAEDLWLERESRECATWAAAAAERGLSASEKQWYAALRAAARQGAFFEASDRLNLSAASRLVGKDRSSAHRAYREIQAQFQAQLRSWA